MRLRPTVASFTAIFAACASTATIQRVDGPDNEAEIERSDGDAIYVRGSNGQLYRIERERLGEIDHPGNVNMIVGACLTGMLALTLASVAGSGDVKARELVPIALIYGAPAVGLLLGGSVLYLRSKEAAHAFETASPSYRMAPAATPADLPPPPPLPRLVPEPPLSPDAGAPLDRG